MKKKSKMGPPQGYAPHHLLLTPPSPGLLKCLLHVNYFLIYRTAWKWLKYNLTICDQSGSMFIFSSNLWFINECDVWLVRNYNLGVGTPKSEASTSWYLVLRWVVVSSSWVLQVSHHNAVSYTSDPPVMKIRISNLRNILLSIVFYVNTFWKKWKWRRRKWRGKSSTSIFFVSHS